MSSPMTGSMAGSRNSGLRLSTQYSRVCRARVTRPSEQRRASTSGGISLFSTTFSETTISDSLHGSSSRSRTTDVMVVPQQAGLTDQVVRDKESVCMVAEATDEPTLSASHFAGEGQVEDGL